MDRPIPPVRTDSPEDGDDFLFWRLANGDIGVDEFRELEARLIARPELRERYLLFMALESSLFETFAPQGDEIPSDRPAQPLPADGDARRTTRRRWIGASIVCLLGLASFVVAFLRPHGDEKPLVTVPPVAPTREVRPPQPSIRYNPLDFVDGPQLAVVTKVSVPAPEDERPSVRMGTRLKAGTLSIERGSMQLEFMSGATVRLEGPAEIRLIAPDNARLIAGKAAVRAPMWAKGFQLTASKTAIVDLGTEFAVDVAETGDSEVQLLEGQVEVSLLSDDGETIESEILSSNRRTIRVSGSGSNLQVVRTPEARLPSVELTVPRALQPPPAYVQQVLESKPLLYWRFENVEDGLVPNEVGAASAGRIIDSADAPAIRIADGFARFTESPAPRYIEPASPESGLPMNSEEMSVELWFNPDYLHWGTMVCVSVDGEQLGKHFFGHIEMAHHTHHSHTPGTVRVLRRYPPGPRGGLNLFDPDGCTPGKWCHVVSTKSPEALTLFVDGRLVRRMERRVKSDSRDYRIMLGQLRWDSPERQFVGALDEFAIYERALTEAEVEGHYRAMMGDAR